MSLKLGSGAINKSYLGSTQINKSYLGDTVIFGGAVEGEVYVNNFDTLDGLILDQSNGTVTSETPIGTVVPNTPKALTFKHTTAGDNFGSVDLGAAYDELYVQFYMSLSDMKTVGSYFEAFQIGSALGDTNLATRLYWKCNSTTLGQELYSATPFVSLSRNTSQGQWIKIGMYLNKANLTVDLYVNGKFVIQNTIVSQDLRYLNFGGNGRNTVGVKYQFTGLTVNELAFQESSITNNPYDLGTRVSHFVDYENGDITWTGTHVLPYDPDGGTNYIDGPQKYLREVAMQGQTKTTWSKRDDIFLLKRGVSHKMETLAKQMGLNLGNGSYTPTNFMELSSYGTGDLPNLDIGVRIDPSDWVVFDAPNNIYRAVVTSVTNCTGAFVNESMGLRGATSLEMETNVGTWREDGTYLYVRMYDNTNPNLSDIDAASSSFYTSQDYCKANNVRFRFGKANASSATVGAGGIIENCEFTLGSGGDMQNSIIRDCVAYDLWNGAEYDGLIGSGDSGFEVNEGGQFYRNTVEDNYIGVQIFSDAHDSVIAFNEFKNTIVNTIQVSGSGVGDPLRPIIIGNNTVFHSPRDKQDDPYPLTRSQPGHGFVNQLGGSANWVFVNNMMLLHFFQNIGGQSVMNLQSQINVNAVGRLDYNKYYLTPISGSPSEVFNQSGNDIVAWRTTLAAYGDYLSIDGVSNPDTNSSVETVLPVTTADATTTSGKFDTTNGVPIANGGGYDYDYASLGITTDLSGNPITSTKNIGAY